MQKVGLRREVDWKGRSYPGRIDADPFFSEGLAAALEFGSWNFGEHVQYATARQIFDAAEAFTS